MEEIRQIAGTMTSSLTPLMQQYFQIKEQHADALMFFQVGDFYELFFDDAKKASAALAITLTARGKNNGDPIPLCGVPVHARDYYVAKLVRAGFRVVICDQLESAVPGKMVARGITQVLTPGTLTDARLLDEKSASYVLALMPLENEWGLIFGELLTGSLTATWSPANSLRDLENELARFMPDEIVLPDNDAGKQLAHQLKKAGYYTMLFAEGLEDENQTKWLEQRASTQVKTQVTDHPAVNKALSFFFTYLQSNRHTACEQFKQVQWYQTNDFLMLDTATQRNLELVRNTQDGGRKNSLLELMDASVTAMGSRMIKKWLLRPLINQNLIEQRLDVIQFFLDDLVCAHELEKILHLFGDAERTIGRIALERATIHDYVHLKRSLEQLPLLKRVFDGIRVPSLLVTLLRQLGDFTSLTALLQSALHDEPHQDASIQDGFNRELDELRCLLRDTTQYICVLEQRERDATGINSLKIHYNQVQGYAFEVTKPNLALVPAHYIRLQTLVGKERFTTPELKQLEERLTHARSQAQELDRQLFDQIKAEVRIHLNSLRKTALSLAYIDALFGLWHIAYQHGYVRPTFNSNNVIYIEQGRHPVIEHHLEKRFVPNAVNLNNEAYVWIVTGPNMGGKSTFLRQVALICIMAQCGSFVPASCASLAIRDRIFTRIGASDNVAEGKSTFLVEMEETAAICTQATKNSLVILDEVGRGTSTFDGLAIAQAVLEHVKINIEAPTLFATHYHELTSLAQSQSGISAYYAESLKKSDERLLTYRIKPGIADGSFGIDVAKLAGLPTSIIQRAEQLLQSYSTKTK